MTYLITLSHWIMSCQPGRHALVMVCEWDWKHQWAAYESFDDTSSFNNLQYLFLRNRSLQILQQYVMCPPRDIREISRGFYPRRFGLWVLSLPVSVCVCVCLSVCQLLLFRAITHHRCQLESPILDRKMQNILLKVPIVLGGWLTLTFQVKFSFIL